MGSGPVFVGLVFCCLLRCVLWRNASLAGGFAGRRVWLVLVFVCFSYRFACSNGHDVSLYKSLSSLCSCKDRAFSATSATLEGKKVLCPFCGFAFPLGLRPFGLLGSLSLASVCVSLVFRCFCCAPSWVWEGPAFSGLVIGSCWLPSLSVVTSPSPSVGPVGRPGPVFTLVPPSGYLVAAVTAQLPCFRAGSVVVLCRPSVNCLMAAKAIKPCVGCFTLSTMLQVMSGSSVWPH